MSKSPPKIITTRGKLRLIHQLRDPESWPNVSDLTLEYEETDAMGHPRFRYVDSWCLSVQSIFDVLSSGNHATVQVALKMLLDSGEVTKDS